VAPHLHPYIRFKQKINQVYGGAAEFMSLGQTDSPA
jgi:hypothetical protein